jgi:hypothetical protein
MKQSHLEELIRQITRSVLKEYTSMVSSNSSDEIKSTDNDNTPPTDAMTSNERKRMERQVELDRQQKIKQKQVELDASKKEREFNRKKLDRQNRFDIPNAQKELQKLKGAKI